MRKLETRVDRNLNWDDEDDEINDEGQINLSPTSRKGKGSDMSTKLRNQALNTNNNIPGANRKNNLEQELY